MSVQEMELPTGNQPSPLSFSLPQFGVHNEPDTLKQVALWQPSIEAVIAQYYPTEQSLFLGSMNVVKARDEVRTFTNVLQNNGVEVICVRSRLASLLTPRNLNKCKVIGQLCHKAKELSETFGVKRPNLKDELVSLMEMDIAQYGEAEALNLAQVLCIDCEQPLGNMVYARDQMNFLGNRRIQSRMRMPIRQPEVHLYEQVYRDSLGLSSPTTVPVGETFEGGDAYMHMGVAFIGVGARTSEKAALYIAETLVGSGINCALVKDPEVDLRPFSEQQDFMHLDMFSMPAGEDEVATREDEAVRRLVTWAYHDRAGCFKTEETGRTFLDFLSNSNFLPRRNEILVIPPEEQMNFGCNFLVLDSNTLLLPTMQNTCTNYRLRQAGKKLVFVDLTEVTQGYGAAHCITGQLLRTPKMFRD